jgi:hypothetical protein
MAGIPRTKLVKDAQLIDRAQIGDSLHARTHAPATLIPFFWLLFVWWTLQLMGMHPANLLFFVMRKRRQFAFYGH